MLFQWNKILYYADAGSFTVEKSTGKRQPGARWILSAGYTLPTPCAALKVPAGVSRLGAAHQPSPAYEVTRFYLATHPRRAWFSTDVLHQRSTRSPCSRGVGRVRVASRRHAARLRAYCAASADKRGKCTTNVRQNRVISTTNVRHRQKAR